MVWGNIFNYYLTDKWQMLPLENETEKMFRTQKL